MYDNGRKNTSAGNELIARRCKTSKMTRELFSKTNNAKKNPNRNTFKEGNSPLANQNITVNQKRRLIEKVINLDYKRSDHHPFSPGLDSIEFLVKLAKRSKIELWVPPTLSFKNNRMSLLFTTSNGWLTGLSNLCSDKIKNYLRTFFYPEQKEHSLKMGRRDSVGQTMIFYDLSTQNICPLFVIKYENKEAKMHSNKVLFFFNVYDTINEIKYLLKQKIDCILQKFVPYAKSPELHRVFLTNKQIEIYKIKHMEGDDQKLGFGVATSDYDKSERADMEEIEEIKDYCVSSLFKSQLKITKLEENQIPYQLQQIAQLLGLRVQHIFEQNCCELQTSVLDFIIDKNKEWNLIQIKYFQAQNVEINSHRIGALNQHCMGLFCKDLKNNELLRRIYKQMIKDKLLTGINVPYFISKTIVTEYDQIVEQAGENSILLPILKYFPKLILKPQLMPMLNASLCEFCFNLYKLFFNKGTIDFKLFQLQKLDKLSARQLKWTDKDINLLLSLWRPLSDGKWPQARYLNKLKQFSTPEGKSKSHLKYSNIKLKLQKPRATTKTPKSRNTVDLLPSINSQTPTSQTHSNYSAMSPTGMSAKATKTKKIRIPEHETQNSKKQELSFKSKESVLQKSCILTNVKAMEKIYGNDKLKFPLMKLYLEKTINGSKSRTQGLGKGISVNTVRESGEEYYSMYKTTIL